MRVLRDTFARRVRPDGGAGEIAHFAERSEYFPAGGDAQRSVAARGGGGGRYVLLAFRDTDDGTPDIHLRSFDTSLSAQQSTAIWINGDSGGGEAGIQTAPSIAANVGGAIYIAWQDETGPSQGHSARAKVRAGTARHRDARTDQHRLAESKREGRGDGERVPRRLESGSDVKLRAIDANGTPSGAEQIVNDASLHQGTQDHPSIAALGYGRVCVTWADHGVSGGADIFVQRYKREPREGGGDQAVRINKHEQRR